MRILITVILSLVTYQVIFSQNLIDSTYAKSIDEARVLIRELKESQKIPGLSVAVAHKGKIIWNEAMGLADVEKGIQATTETTFRIGSISKTITILALAKLFDEGKFDWDDPLNKYIKVGTLKEQAFTIRQLAGHLSGVRHYKGFEFFSNKQYNSLEESLEVFKDDKLLFEPGTEYKYTTYGYSLLGRLIEVLSGQPYADYISSEITSKFGMDHTILEDANFDESGSSVFYSKGGKRTAREINVSVKWPGGGFLSTPADIVNMINNASKAVSLSTVQELITPQKLPDGSTTGYGMGFRLSVVESTGQLIAHHGGSMVGARSYFLVIPDQQFAIAVCTNSEADYGVLELNEIAKKFLR